MGIPWKIIDTTQVARYDEYPITNVPFFKEDEFSGCLLGFLPDQVLPRHYHEHEHEVFDVLAGTGTIWLDGQPLEAGPGTTVLCRPGLSTVLRTPAPTAG